MTSSTAAPSGANAKKLLVVGLLACLLLVVLWQNLGGGSTPPSPAAVLVSTPAPAALAPVLKPRAALSEVLQAWPTIELPQLLAHNPFQTLELVAEQTTPSTDDPASVSGQLPPSDSRGSPAAETAQATSQPSLQINAILSGGRRPAVLIGQRLYYERDEIAGEWRILAIHPNRVALEPLASSSAQPVAVSWSANGRQSPDNDQADQNQAPQ